ncbi:MAG: hypothetical protein AAFW69_09345, partial [Pseudomonadota bacterium]
QQAGLLLNYGYMCQNGDQQACQIYQQGLGQLQQAYTMTQQALQSGQFGNPNQVGQGYSTYDHNQRMGQIHQWGQQMLQQGRQNQQLLDDNHRRFMQTLQ